MRTNFVTIAALDHRLPVLAAAILEVQHAAYTLEARLLGVSRFPPLERTVTDILQSNETFLGARIGDELVGVLSHQPGTEPGERDISSLVVSPAWHRQGIARKLLAAVLRDHTELVFTVSTGARNGPALQLYSQFGFVEHDRCVKGPAAIEVVSLRLSRKAPEAGQSA